MSNFKDFAKAVHAQFVLMSQHELYETIDGRALSDLYLASYPEGTNPIFRTNTEHDCSCCKQFIRNVGNAVAIVDGKLVSVWDAPGLEYPYDQVAAALAKAVKSHPITGLFRREEPNYGAETSKELREGGYVHTWDHFHAKIDKKHLVRKGSAKSAAAVVGDFSITSQMLKRALTELTPAAFTTVLDLIDSNALYRGAEFRAGVIAFMGLQVAYENTRLADRETFIWANAGSPAARLRNTVMGTLLIDLSNDMPIEQAVKSFEDKMSGTNYKRPTALITPGMVKTAMATLTSLGLEPALERRHARLSDVSVNNVLWVNGEVQGKMKDGVEGLLMAAAAPGSAKKADKAEDITIADFLANVLPQTQSMEVLVRNSQQGNFMSITAPVHADALQLFKWGNNFGWSYDNNVADSIKERVKAAGGSVEGDLCCRLAWEYDDDLDFHMREPNGGHIFYADRNSRSGGHLDVDANGGDGLMAHPVENIFYKDRRKMVEGVYLLDVHNFNRRSTGRGFEVEIEFDGQTHRIVSDKALRSKESITVAKINYTHADGFRIIESLPATTGAAKGTEKWGVQTETFVKVNTVMLSPNHWDDNASGNKHWFFLLDGCKNPTPTRGIYNEFLKSGLEQHRKVFEVLGDKTKCPVVDDQLSGVGFSSTRGDSLIVNVTGAKLRKTYNITF